MRLKTICRILEAAKLGKVGKNIFEGRMPAEVATGILLRDGFSGTVKDHYLPGLFQTDFQLIVRHADFEQGHTLIEAAIAALEATKETEFSDMYIRYLRARGLPFSYPLSASNVIEFVTQIDVGFNIV
jgi:hypothetical protein